MSQQVSPLDEILRIAKGVTMLPDEKPQIVYLSGIEYDKQKVKDLMLDVVGEDLKPDVQLGSNSYIYSGEAEGINKFKALLRQRIEAL